MTARTVSKKPIMMHQSELWHQDKNLARELNGDGFVPILAERLQPGDEAVFFDTDVFQMRTVGGYRTSTVRRLEWEEGVDSKGRPWKSLCGVLFDGEREPTYAEDYMEVWVR